MTINTDLLIAAPMLQDYLVDKDSGLPLTNGIISLFKDNARSFYKNWYYQTGSPGSYAWIALDNPLHLSAAGTIQDPNGNDVIPFYYPFEENNENIREAYYITVYSSDENGDPAILQFTRENFPFIPSNVPVPLESPTFRNYILNNIYWRNIGTLDADDETNKVIAPSQHEGYTNGDIRFIKNITGANDDLSFSPMTEELDDDITPEYYLNAECTGVQVGETVKCIQYPISLHVKTLQNVEASLVFHGQNVAGSPNNFVDIYIYQFLGTGAASQPDPILVTRFTLNNDWEKQVFQFILPNFDDPSTGLTLGAGGDDALFLRVQYPLSAIFNINHTKPQLYLSTDVPNNDFDTYDQVEGIINSPRTGDVRTSLNGFQPYGYVQMTDGTIGNASSNATSRADIDAWPLFSLIWNGFNGITNATTFLPIFTSAGAPSAYGASAIADWNANKQLSLPKSLGRAILGSMNDSTRTAMQGQAYTRSADTLVMATTAQFFTGAPVILTSTGTPPTGVGVNTVYYAILLSGTTISLATTYANAIAESPIGLSSNGTGINNVFTYLPATIGGEYAHTLIKRELPNPITDNANTFNAGGGGTAVIQDGTSGATGNVANPLGGSAHNNVQPFVFFNIFMKL